MLKYRIKKEWLYERIDSKRRGDNELFLAAWKTVCQGYSGVLR